MAVHGQGWPMASEDARLARVFALSKMTREEYVEWSKETALRLLRDGRIRGAIGILAAAAGDVAAARAYIDGF